MPIPWFRIPWRAAPPQSWDLEELEGRVTWNPRHMVKSLQKRNPHCSEPRYIYRYSTLLCARISFLPSLRSVLGLADHCSRPDRGGQSNTMQPFSSLTIVLLFMGLFAPGAAQLSDICGIGLDDMWEFMSPLADSDWNPVWQFSGLIIGMRSRQLWMHKSLTSQIL
ncbi:hypothetical protein C8J56DRAFT_950296 [Mycena floridula]|nr:hypothetical protein C8J56DRAFT_950296 [Mycena floridula]